MPYIYSTLTCDQEYSAHGEAVDGGVKPVLSSVIINGQANLTNRQLITPLGVATFVTDEQMKVLNSSSMFKRHLAAGYLTVDKSKTDANKVAKDMVKKDNSAPITADDDTDPTVIKSKKLTKVDGKGTIESNALKAGI